jgi:hypothetical protein
MAYQPANPIQTITPGQVDLIKMLTGLSSNATQKMAPDMMGDPAKGFDPIQQKAVSSYNAGLPTLAERFQTIRNPQDTSFMDQLQAGRGNFMESLGAMRSNYAMDGRHNQQEFLKTLLHGGLTQQFEPVMRKQGPNFWSQFGATLMKYLPDMMKGTKV